MIYYGDIAPGKTLYFPFNTADGVGAPITLGGAAAARVYKNGDTVEDDSGITVVVDFDSRTGSHHVAVDTSTDLAFYASGAEYRVIVTVGTVSGTSIAGLCVGSFSILNRATNVKQVNDVLLQGVGTTLNPWRPA